MSISPDLLSVAIRALGFVALFQAAGTSLFLAAFGGSMASSRRIVARIGCAGACIGMALLALHLWLDAARMAGSFSGLTDATLLQLAVRSSAGASQAVQFAALGLIALSVGAPRRSVVAAAGAVLAVAAFALTGHTTVQPLRPVLALLLVVHLLVVAFWFGALLPLGVITRLEAAATAARIVGRFSAAATWLVPLIGLAGVSLAALLSGRLAVLHMPYGQLLLAKLGGWLLLLLLGAYNKWQLTPALAAGAPHLAGRRLRRSMAAEYALIVAILCTTAILTTFFSPT